MKTLATNLLVISSLCIGTGYATLQQPEDDPHRPFSVLNIKVDKDNAVAKFFPLNKLCERLKNNVHGDTLDISQSNFMTESPAKIFSALSRNKSVKRLVLNHCLFGKDFEARELGAFFARTKYIQQIDLEDTTFSNDDLEALANGLAINKSISFLNLQGSKGYDQKGIEKFYEIIRNNRTLTMILWSRNNTVNQIIPIAIPGIFNSKASNPVAKLNLAILYLEGVTVPTNTNKGKQLLESIDHRMALYYLGLWHQYCSFN